MTRNPTSITAKDAKSPEYLENLYQLVTYWQIHLSVAAKELGISKRQLLRRLRAWRSNGPKSFVHGNTGRPAPNRLPQETKNRIIEFIRGKYQGFPPLLLAQYLQDHEGIKVSKETVRRILKALNPDVSEEQHREAGYFLRRRRARFGELLQVDGSPHHWFVDDSALYCLIAFIDDATGMITSAHFCPTETAKGYMIALVGYIRKYGIPLALYGDRHSIFKKTLSTLDSAGETQFRRACDQLNIELIYALSPQAKGRVERLFKTLQGRWPLEFRAQGIKDIDTANKRLPEFIAEFNARYAIEPQNAEDANCPVANKDMPQVERICALWHERILSKSLTVSYGKCLLQVINAEGSRLELMGQNVYLVEYPDERPPEMLYKPRGGPWTQLIYQARQKKTLEPVVSLEETAKTIDARVESVVKNALNRDNPFVSRHYKQATKDKERKEKKAQKIKEANKLEEKVALIREKNKVKR